jgi:hypothetical protein
MLMFMRGLTVNDRDERRLQLHARIAGFLFLFYIAAVAIGGLLASLYTDVADVPRTGDSVLASGLGFRAGLTLQLLGGMTAIPLGFSLYVVLQPVDRDWALAGFIWRIVEGTLNGVASAFRFAGVIAVARATANSLSMRSAEAAAAALFPISVLSFSIGSLIFFRLLVRARFLPVWLGWMGVVGSLLATVLGLATLLLPSPPPWLPLLWGPLSIAEIGGGLLLLVKGADLRDFKKGLDRPGVTEVSRAS